MPHIEITHLNLSAADCVTWLLTSAVEVVASSITASVLRFKIVSTASRTYTRTMYGRLGEPLHTLVTGLKMRCVDGYVVRPVGACLACYFISIPSTRY